MSFHWLCHTSSIAPINTDVKPQLTQTQTLNTPPNTKTTTTSSKINPMHHTTITSQQCAELDQLYKEICLKLTPSLTAIQYRHTPSVHGDSHDWEAERLTRLQQADDDHAHIIHIGHAHDAENSNQLANKLHQLNTEQLTFLTITYNEWAHYLHTNEEKSQHTCPMCGQPNLIYRHTDKLYTCHKCEGCWTTPQLANATQLAINTLGKWITRRQACQQYGISPETLRKRIQRGQIQTKQPNLIYEPHLHATTRQAAA